jgi:hypothetical protein
MGENQNQGVEATLNWYAVNRKNFTLVSAEISDLTRRDPSLGIMNDFGYEPTGPPRRSAIDFWIAKGGRGSDVWIPLDGRYEGMISRLQCSNNRWILKGGCRCSAWWGSPSRLDEMKDLDGNGIIDVEDREIIGDANPVHTGGFTINSTSTVLTWQQPSTGVYGNDIYNANKIEFTQPVNTSTAT